MKETLADYPELVAQLHPTKNGDLSPSGISPRIAKKLWWKCSIANDHEWEAAIFSRVLNGNGCPCCRGFKVVSSNCLATTHPALAAEWHPTKNGNLTAHDIVAGAGKKIWWKCSVGNDHEWEASPSQRINHASGCPCCSGRKVATSNCLATRHPTLAAEWHPTKNGNLTAHDIVAGSNKKVWWRCPAVSGHEWEASVNQRNSQRNGCPFCNESKGEKAVVKALTNLGLLFKRQWRFSSCRNKRPLVFDFVVKTTTGVKVIEYQGEQHYRPFKFRDSETQFSDVQKRDSIKREWCQKKKLPLLEIPYWRFSEVESIVQDFITQP